MKIYKSTNVYDEAKSRISFIFDEFEEIVVGFSGGKDSTVVLGLAMEEAERRGRLPLNVLFIDQEAEWQNTIDYMKSVMYDKRVKPYWIQVPIRLFNATSTEEDWLYCWKDGDEWIRPKDEISIKENTYGTDRFHKMFNAVINKEFAGKKTAMLGGIRTEESPSRRLSMTTWVQYKHITYGKQLDKEGQQFTFYPIYDWSYTDVWKYIHESKLRYNKIYDYMYNYGVTIRNMRVSNLHHETAVTNLYILQELEPDTWNKLVKRLNGIDTIAKLEKKDAFSAPKQLPFMFKNWKEYRDYLLEHLITNEETREKFRDKFKYYEKYLLGMNNKDSLYRTEITTILTNDYHGTKLHDFTNSNKNAAEFVERRNYMKRSRKKYEREHNTNPQ